MAHVKRLGWVLVGVLIGGFGSGSLSARRPSQEQPSRRLVTLPALPLSGSVSGYFIRDAKTDACWLMIRSRDDLSGTMSPAPSASCEP